MNRLPRANLPYCQFIIEVGDRRAHRDLPEQDIAKAHFSVQLIADQLLIGEFLIIEYTCTRLYGLQGNGGSPLYQ